MEEVNIEGFSTSSLKTICFHIGEQNQGACLQPQSVLYIMAEIVLERFVNINDSVSKDDEVIVSIPSRHVQALCSTAVFLGCGVEMGSCIM